MIYENGYFLEADIDTVAARIIKSIGSRWVSNKQLVVRVIHSLAESGLIDKKLLAEGVLTSGSIQKRWLEKIDHEWNDDDTRDICGNLAICIRLPDKKLFPFQLDFDQEIKEVNLDDRILNVKE